MNSLYGYDIFDSIEQISCNEVLESSKIFLEVDDTLVLSEADTNTFKDKILKTLNTVIEKLKQFLEWISTKVKQFFRNMGVRFKALDLKKKLNEAKSRLSAKNEAVDDLPDKLLAFLKTQVDIYRVPESTSSTLKKVYNINTINIEQNSDGDYILTVPGKGLKSEFIECFKNTVEVFIDKYQLYVLSLQSVGDKLTASASALQGKLRSLQNKYKEIKNMEAIESLKALKDNMDKEDNLSSDMVKVNTLIKNHTYAINAITESINRMMTISKGIEHQLASL